MDIEKSDYRISVFKNPIVSIKTPSSWVDEAIRYEEYIAETEATSYRGWASSRRICKRAFAAYYGLKKQFNDRHNDWKKKRPRYDFHLTDGNSHIDIVVQTMPIKDYKPKIGKNFTINVWKPWKDSSYPIIHVIMAYWTPICFMIGWISNDDLKAKKTELTESKLNPIYSHPLLFSLDKRGMYV
jgi:hypothetical protein